MQMQEDAREHNNLEIISDDFKAETDLAETSLTAVAENESISIQVRLNEEAQKLVNQLASERDFKKTQEITQKFNDIQYKKNLARVLQLSEVQDKFTEQIYQRILTRPDEISNKEMLDGMKVIQDLMERSQKQTPDINDVNLIQINNPEITEVGISTASNNLSRDSRERVKNAVQGLLSSLIVPTTSIEASVETNCRDTENINERDKENGEE